MAEPPFMAEDSGQRTEDRGQKTDDRGRITEDRYQVVDVDFVEIMRLRIVDFKPGYRLPLCTPGSLPFALSPFPSMFSPSHLLNFLPSYFLPSNFYYSFIVLSHEYINIYTRLFIRAPSFVPVLIVIYENFQLIENLGNYFFAIPSDETGLEFTLM